MNRFLRILLYLTILFNCIPDAFADRFRVSDEYVTVFAEPERITNLGRAYRGEVYESEGTDGSMFVFTFHGRKAYIASYCCEWWTKAAASLLPTETAVVNKARPPSLSGSRRRSLLRKDVKA